MRIDWKRYLPLGLDGINEKRAWIIGMVASLLWSMLFLLRYSNAYSYLYYWNNARTERILVEGAMMRPFPDLMVGLMTGFWMLAMYMLGVGVYFYMYHYRDSKSIYLMRRLPDRWELHRRCLTVPVLAAVASLLSSLVLTGIYYGIYILCTPVQCLP